MGFMTLITVPYGSTELSAEIPDRNFLSTILPHSAEESGGSPSEIIRRALENPIGTKRLCEMAGPSDRIALFVNDITRPTPTAVILPFVLEELGKAGVPDDHITIFFALGLHRSLTEEECIRITGEEIYRRIRCVQHEVGSYPVRHFGETSRATPVEIYEDIAENDLLVAVGEIGFHYYAGYSGGAKSILPGVSSKDSVIANHKRMIEKNAVSGRTDSPVRLDLEEAAGMVGLDFILNVVIDSHKNVIAAFAGHYIEAHRAGVKVVDRMYKVKVAPADAVIVSCGGYPKDINLYQTNKALDNAVQAVREGGSVIVVSECRDGIGNDIYDRWNRECRTKEDAVERFSREFEFGGHKAAKTAAAAMRYKIYLVSSLTPEKAEEAFFIPAASVQAAIDDVLKNDPDTKFSFIPYGGQTLPTQE